jgi:hypothetical protein
MVRDMKEAAIDYKPTAAETCVDCKVTPFAVIRETDPVLRWE